MTTVQTAVLLLIKLSSDGFSDVFGAITSLSPRVLQLYLMSESVMMHINKKAKCGDKKKKKASYICFKVEWKEMSDYKSQAFCFKSFDFPPLKTMIVSRSDKSIFVLTNRREVIKISIATLKSLNGCLLTIFFFTSSDQPIIDTTCESTDLTRLFIRTQGYVFNNVNKHWIVNTSCSPI